MTTTDVSTAKAVNAFNGTFEPFKYSLKQWTKSSLMYGVLFGFTLIASAVSYLSFYHTSHSREVLSQAFGHNVATIALFGPTYDLSQLAGFLVLKSFFTLIIVGSMWAIFATTKSLRGDEERGYFEHYLAGTVTLKRVYLQILCSAFVGLAILSITVFMILFAGDYLRHLGLGLFQCLYYCLCVVAAPLIFVALGSLACQIFASRKSANAFLGWALGFFYALRLVGDSGIGLHWLDFISPIGWVELLHPMIRPRPMYFMPIIIFSILCFLISGAMVASRDLGEALFDDSAPEKISKRYLRSDLTYSIYHVKTTLYSWFIAITLTGAVLGLVASSAGSTLNQSSIKTVFDRIGISGNGTQSFLGFSFVIVAVLFSFMSLGQINTFREQEIDGHLDNFLTLAESRTRWILNRIAVTLVSELIAGIVCAIVMAATGYFHGSGMSFLISIFAILNLLPSSILVIGVATLAFGLIPSKTVFTGYFVIGWSMMVEIVAGFGKSSQYLLDTSIFHQISPYPAAKINVISVVLMLVIGILGLIVGVYYFGSRDIASR